MKKRLHELIMENIEKEFFGKKTEVRKLLVALFAQGHVLIEDVPGVGKTSLSSALAKSINGSFKRIQFTPDTTPSDIIGFNMFNVETKKFEYIEGSVLNNIVLADELNRTSPKTQAALLEAMQEGNVTVDGQTYEVPKPFILIATQNTNEQFGTYPLPESQLDRFMLSLELGYPEREVAENILRGVSNKEEIKGTINLKELEDVQLEVEQIYTSESILEYIIDISESTRRNQYLKYGISTRATIHITQAAKANAYIEGRDYVNPDDIKFLIHELVKHRLVISRAGVQHQMNITKVINDIVKAIPVPTLKKDSNVKK